MRTKFTLWKVSNGYLLVPSDCDAYLQNKDAQDCSVFKTLKEFAEWKPKRLRRVKPKAQQDTRLTAVAAPNK